MAAYCRKSAKKLDELKLAELKNQDNPENETTEAADFITLSMAEVAHYIHNSRKDV